jgi:hypothetical protein
LIVKGQKSENPFFLENKEVCLETADILVRNQILRFLQFFPNEKTKLRKNYFEIGLFSRKNFVL